MYTRFTCTLTIRSSYIDLSSQLHEKRQSKQLLKEEPKTCDLKVPLWLVKDPGKVKFLIRNFNKIQGQNFFFIIIVITNLAINF